MIEIVALSDAMREAVRLAERVAPTEANVLVTGESGAGKDALASFIHELETRVAVGAPGKAPTGRDSGSQNDEVVPPEAGQAVLAQASVPYLSRGGVLFGLEGGLPARVVAEVAAVALQGPGHDEPPW